MVKNMKKVICGILCMLMVFSMFTVSAATLAIDEANIVVGDADATTGLRTVTIPYTVTVGSDEEAPAYLTMLASKTETVDAQNINTSAIGIEQIANDSAVTSISFVTDKIEEGVTYYVKMGATNLAEPAKATFTLNTTGDDEGGDEPTVPTYTMTENTGLGTRTLYNLANVSILRFTGIADGNVVTVGEGENAVVARTYVAPATDTEASETVHVAVIDTTKTDKTKVTVAAGTPAVIAIGNANLDNSNRVNGTDVTVLSKALAGGTLDVTNLFKVFASDVDGNGRVNGTDVTVLSKAIAGGVTSSVKGYTIK